MKKIINFDYMMPEEYKGLLMKQSSFVKNPPRKWTKDEEKWVIMLKEKGFSTMEIAYYTDRSTAQISNKLRRLGKSLKTYNKRHYQEKMETNSDFLNVIKPKSILDVFAGEESVYKKFNCDGITSNDHNYQANTDYNMDASKLIALLYSQNKKYDLIDLDPYGNAYDCFDHAIKMAKKGLVITLGELGQKRFNRVDFAERYYGIKKLEDFTAENLVNHIIKIGRRNKKELKVVYLKNWKCISRVYFKIEKLDTTYKGLKS